MEEQLVLKALRNALMLERERYNTLFALARRARPKLCAERFSHNLETYLGGLLGENPTEAAGRVSELYEIVLELSGQELFQRSEAVRCLWTKLLPGHFALWSEDSAKAVASLTNAAYNLECEPGVDWRFWLQRMDQLAESCESLSFWLQSGQVLAWVCGMAHYQESALGIASRLPETLMNSLIPRWDKVRSDPWWPRRPSQEEIAAVYQVGGFVGFGGTFRRPPEVVVAGPERFLVSDGESDWLLFCDGFGATLKRVRDFQLCSSEPGKAEIAPDGRISWAGCEKTFPFLESVSSSASTGQVAAITSALSHHVYIFLGPGM